VSITADSITQFLMPTLAATSGKPKLAFHDWAIQQRYGVINALPSGEATLVPYSTTEIVETFAHDYLRLSCAALESMVVAQDATKLPKSVGWIAVRAYYAAFFSANAMRRAFGSFVTRLDSNHAASIEEIVEAFFPGLGASFSKGQYEVSWNTISGMVTVRKLNGGGAGGFHETFWSAFADFVIAIQTKLLTPGAIGLTTDLQSAAADLDRVVKLLRSAGSNGGTYLSGVRNAVQYAQSYQAWFPYGEDAGYYSSIKSMAESDWKKPFSTQSLPPVKDRLKHFMAGCCLLVALNREITERLARAGSKKSFLQYGPLSLPI